MNKQTFSLSEYADTICEVLESGGEFRIYPSGTSMLPLLRQGKDSVSLSKPSGYLKKNDIAFYRRDNGAYILHRVIKSENGVYTMCGDNQIDIEENINHNSVIGVVTRLFRNDKPFDMNGIGYRFYLFIWRSFLIRRIYLKLKFILKESRKNDKT